MKKIMVVFGTRPEAIKMCPLVNELKIRKGIETIVCVTGQHQQMLYQVLDIFGVNPDYDLKIMKAKQDLFDITTTILNNIKNVLEQVQPDIVLIHGDTSTTFATALACFYKNIKIGHVEAGLRTYNLKSPFPEEFNRQVAGIVADYHFAPTMAAKKHLLEEGNCESTIFVTGNTGIDALKTTVREDYHSEILDWAGNSRLLLLTAHRRENQGRHMEEMFRAIQKITADYPNVRILYPVHKNPSIRRIAEKMFTGLDNVKMIEPMDVFDFHNILARCYMVLTDSGGIQEEAPALGKPVLVMRDTTERPEGVDAGTLKLVGTSENSIYMETKHLLEDKEAYQKMATAINPYGDGTACVRIADVLCSMEWLK